MGKRRRYSINIDLGGSKGANLIVRGVLSKMEEDVSVELYDSKADGFKDYSKEPISDITNGFMKMVMAFVLKVIKRRVRPYDSTTLIVALVEKMPDDKLEEMLKKITLKEL